MFVAPSSSTRAEICSATPLSGADEGHALLHRDLQGRDPTLRSRVAVGAFEPLGPTVGAEELPVLVEAGLGGRDGRLPRLADPHVEHRHAILARRQLLAVLVVPHAGELLPLALEELGMEVPPHTADAAAGHRVERRWRRDRLPLLERSGKAAG